MMSTAPTTARTSAVAATLGTREARSPDRAALVERIAARLAEESAGRAGATSSERRMLEVLIGHWLEEEFAAIDRSRIREGVPVLDSGERRHLRDAVVADVL